MQLQGHDGIDDLREKLRDVVLREATAAALVTFLETRGLAVIPAEVAAIRGCTDHAAIQRWLLRATHVAAVAELFVDP